MYDFLNGKLMRANPPELVLEVNGVGYRLHPPLSLFGLLPPLGSLLQLYTSFVVREQSHQLFGFQTREQRDLFEALTTVSGVGPKSALALLSHLQADALCSAVESGDWAQIAQAPGIGRKTAERLIIEMRGRLQTHNTALPLAGDAINALINLGYKQAAAQKAVEKILKTEAPSDLSGVITAALKKL